MRKQISFVLAISISIATLLSSTGTACAESATDNVWPEESKCPKVILDVDMSTDVDDLSAVRIMENLNSCMAQRLVAVGTSVTDGDAALAGLLTADGYNQIPVGISSTYNPDPGSPYWSYLEGFMPANQRMDAVKLYRKTLAESSTRVSIATTGYLTNIEALLKSGADEYSPLTGAQLIADKVRALHITGGTYSEGFDNNFGAYANTVEAADYCFSSWPSDVPMIIYTNDLGANITTGLQLSGEDPVRDCFLLAGKENGSTGWDAFNTWAFECIDSGQAENNNLGLVPCSIRMRSGTRENVFGQPSEKKIYRVVKTCQDEDFYQGIVSSFEHR